MAAFLLDALPIVGLAVLAVVLMYLTRNRLCDGDTSARDLGAQCASVVSPLGVIAFVAGWLAMLGYLVWNFGYRQGRTGSSIGKSAMGLRVVDVGVGRADRVLALGDPATGARDGRVQRRTGLPVAVVGRQESDVRRQAGLDGIRACRGQRNALTPVSASPMTIWCTSDVPS